MSSSILKALNGGLPSSEPEEPVSLLACSKSEDVRRGARSSSSSDSEYSAGSLCLEGSLGASSRGEVVPWPLPPPMLPACNPLMCTIEALI